MSKYNKVIRSEIVDVYDVLEAFNVTCPALQHGIKKMLMPGMRGDKSTMKDLQEAQQSIVRAIELQMAREENIPPSKSENFSNQLVKSIHDQVFTEEKTNA